MVGLSGLPGATPRIKYELMPDTSVEACACLPSCLGLPDNTQFNRH